MKTVLPALVVALAVLLAWALTRGTQRPIPAVPLATSPGPAEAQATPLEITRVEARDREETGVRRAQVLETTLTPSPAAPLDSTAQGTLEVLVVARESGAPVVGVSLLAQPLGEEAVVGARTDERGRARLVVTSGAIVQIRVLGSSEASIRHLEPLARGETRTVRLEIDTPTEARLVGRVLDEANGQPVAGARVHPLPDARARPALAASRPESRTPEWLTDSQGWFEATVTTGRREDWQVEAPGFGPRLFQPDGTHADRERALVVRLSRAAILRGFVRGAAERGDLVVLARAHGFEFSVGAGAGGLDALQRRAPVSANGTWEMTDLPPRAGLQLELRGGETLLREEPQRLYLEPGEERTLEWTLEGGAALHGRAVIADSGAPVPGVSVWLVPARTVVGHLRSGMQPVAQTTTDEAGTFSFQDVAPGEWAVGPAPQDRNRPSGELESELVAPAVTRVSISAEAWTVDVELRLHRGLFLRGVVLGPDGARATEARIDGFHQELDFWDSGYTTDGTFRLGPLLPGPYRLRASGYMGTSPSEAVDALAGDDEVELRLNAGGTIAGRLVDAATGEPLQGFIKIHHEQGPGGISSRTQPDGSFSFPGLALGSHTVSGSSGELAGRVRGVVIGPEQSLANVEVPLEAGSILLVTYTGEQAFCTHTISSEGLRWGMGRYERGQTSRVVRVPGEVVVIVTPESADGNSHTIERTVNLIAGEETRVEIGDE
jgi:hypothetical protein